MVRGTFSAVLTAALAAACLSPTDEVGDEIHRGAVERWAQVGPPSYSFVLTRVCVCAVTGEPIRIEVLDLVVVSRTYVSDDTPLEPEHHDDFPDVPGLFDLIEEVRQSKPSFFNASYDGTYGFPATVIINITPARTDDDLSLTVTEFTPLN
jgi:Family of unknown function (DUF6174)